MDETVASPEPRPDDESGLAVRLRDGPFPERDGWGGLYRLFEQIAPAGSGMRRALCRYYWPRALERRRDGRLYSLLGVRLFGRVIPTGGILVRRLTGARMAPYTLRGPSLGAAREFYYRTCVFESLHLPFLVALGVLTLRQLAAGRFDLAAEDMVVNLLVNAFPIMHHRRTRARIVNLLAKTVDDDRPAQRRQGRPKSRGCEGHAA